jgi:hypothetical protein
MKDHYRQGDVLIQAITGIPAKAVKQPKAAQIVLAHGTATGHHHMLVTAPYQIQDALDMLTRQRVIQCLGCNGWELLYLR